MRDTKASDQDVWVYGLDSWDYAGGVPPCLSPPSAYAWGVSTTALHIIELVKSLPLADQQLVCAILPRHLERARKLKRPQFLRTPDGRYYNPEGVPNDDPFFKIMEDIEAERHRTPGRPAPAFD